jgi:hypothetical protein
MRLGDTVRAAALPLGAVAGKAEAREADEHRRPGRGLGNRGERPRCVGVGDNALKRPDTLDEIRVWKIACIQRELNLAISNSDIECRWDSIARNITLVVPDLRIAWPNSMSLAIRSRRKNKNVGLVIKAHNLYRAGEGEGGRFQKPG